jgi:hypothetical protein
MRVDVATMQNIANRMDATLYDEVWHEDAFGMSACEHKETMEV